MKQLGLIGMGWVWIFGDCVWLMRFWYVWGCDLGLGFRGSVMVVEDRRVLTSKGWGL